MAKCSFFLAWLNGTNFSGSLHSEEEKCRSAESSQLPRRRFISLLVSQGSIQSAKKGKKEGPVARSSEGRSPVHRKLTLSNGGGSLSSFENLQKDTIEGEEEESSLKFVVIERLGAW